MSVGTETLAFVEALGGIADVDVGAHRVMIFGEISEERVEQHAADTDTAVSLCNGDA